MPLEPRNRAEPARPPFSPYPLFVMPITPKKRVEIELAEAADGRGHLALKRLPPHLAVGHNLQADALLQSDSIVDGSIFDGFKFSRCDRPCSKLFLSFEQLLWPQ